MQRFKSKIINCSYCDKQKSIRGDRVAKCRKCHDKTKISAKKMREIYADDINKLTEQDDIKKPKTK